MATTPEKTKIECYEILLNQKQGSIDDSIWSQFPGPLKDEKELLSDELNKKKNLEYENIKSEKTLRDLGITSDKFNRTEYDKLLPLIKLSYAVEKNGDPYAHAIKLIVAFGSKNKAIEYLKKCEEQNRSSVHDACLFTPPSGKWNAKLWQGLADRYMLDKRFHNIFSLAQKIEQYVEIEKLKEKAKEKVREKWTEKLGIEYANIPRTEEQYLKKNEKQIEKEVNQKFGLFLQTKISTEKNKYIKSEEGLAKRKEIEELVKDRFKTQFREKFGSEIVRLEKKTFIEDGMAKNKKIIEDEASNLVLSSVTPLETLIEYSTHFKYARSEENPIASKIFSKTEMTEEAFDTYLKLTPKDSERIPPLLSKDKPIPILIDGSEIDGSYSEYYLTKLSPSDPRCAVLGKMSSCCQHLDNAGKDCAIHGIESEEGGFYVLCKKAKKGLPPSLEDPVVSQCWAWRSRRGALVFDSVESMDHYRASESHKMMTSDFFTLWSHKLVTEHQIPQVLVGESNTPKSLGSLRPISQELPRDYNGYRDSHEQRIVADKSLPFLKLYVESQHGKSKLTLPKESKEKMELKKTKELEQMFKRWCMLCAVNEKDLLSIIADQAKTSGIDDYQLDDWFSKSKKCIKLMNNNPTDLEKIVELASQGIMVKKFEGSTALMLASAAGRTDIVEALLKTGAAKSISEKNKDGDTALMLASAAGGTDIVEALLKAGAAKFINEKNKDDNTALRIASKKGHAAVVEFLLKAGAVKSINKKNKDGDTALMLASREGHVDVVNVLLKEGAKKFINEKTIYRNTALMMASKEGHADVVEALLKNGAGESINDRDGGGRTALIYAAKSGNFETVKKLIEYGADLDITDKKGFKAIGYVSDKNDKLRKFLKKTKLLKILMTEKQVYLTDNEKLAFIEKAIKTINDNSSSLSLFENDTSGMNLLMLAAQSEDSDIMDAIFEVWPKESIKNIDKPDKKGKTALIYAIQQGNFYKVELLLDKGANIEAADNNGVTPLMYAAYEGNFAMVSFLLERGASINARSKKGIKAVDYVSKKNDKLRELFQKKSAGKYDAKKSVESSSIMTAKTKLLNILANKKQERPTDEELDFIEKAIKAISGPSAPSLNSIKDDVSGMSLLIFAAQSKNPDFIDAIFKVWPEESINNIDKPDKEGMTALMHAIEAGNLGVAGLLLKNRANIEARDNDGSTPLMYAATEGDLEMVSFLLKKGASITAQDKAGWTVLMYAAQGENPEVISKLLSIGVVKKSIDKQDKNGMTALMHAVETEDDNSVFELIFHGASVDIVDENEMTALTHAVSTGNPNLVALLLNYGANIEAADKDGSTPLMHAAGEGDLEMVSFLLKKRASTTARDKAGWTVLMYAAQGENPAVISKLLEISSVKESINERDENGMTALMHAAETGDLSSVVMLIEGGARVDITDENGTTALMYALRGSNDKLISKLLEAEMLSRSLDKSSHVKEQTESAPLLFSQSSHHSVKPSSDRIVEEANKFKNCEDTEELRQFKNKLGFKESDKVKAISNGMIEVEDENGSTASFDIKERYEEHLERTTVHPKL